MTGYQAQVALFNIKFRVMMYGADHMHVSVMFDNLAQFVFMTVAAEIIQDDALDIDVLVKSLVAKNQWCDAACHAAGIQYKHHGGVQQLG